MLVLGINELYHDCSAALVADGRLAAVVEEERLNRVKHTPGLCWGGGPPTLSIDWCMAELGVTDADVDAVALSYEMSGYLAVKTIVDAVLSNLRRMHVHDIINQRVRGGDHAASVVYGNLVGYFLNRKLYLRELNKRFPRVVHVPHHRAHAASAFRMSGLDEANILVVDGLGEDDSTSLFHGVGNRIEGPFQTWSQYQSLGMLYKTVTFLLGFGYFGDGRTMGLSSYGEFRPEWSDILTTGSGGYRIHLERLRKLSPYARRSNDEPLTQDHKDIAKTIQLLLEGAAVELAKNLHQRTGCRSLCVAGGVGLNCNMNSVLRQLPFVDELFVQPGAMDMGTAIGAAMEVSAQLGVESKERLNHVYYGPHYDNGQIEAAIARRGLQSHRMDDDALTRHVAQQLVDEAVVAWFDGKLEFGPRALGHRTIMARPDSAELRDRVNDIKQRERWRPLAPVMLEEDVADWFEAPGPSPFMTLTLSYLPGMAERVPGAAHVDGTARIQSVRRDQNPRYYDVIARFKEATGLPMVLNTSFNRRGEPIVCTPDQAIDTFLARGMDGLVLGNHYVQRPR